MDNNKLKPLSRQLLPRIVATVLAMGLLILSLNLWLYQSIHLLESRIEQDLPNAKLALTQSHTQLQLQKLYHQINSLTQGEITGQLNDELLAVLNGVQRVNKNANFSNIFEFDSTVVERLSQKSASNELIRQAGINQVSLLLSSIEGLLENADKNKTSQIISLRYINSLLIDILTDLQMLDLQMSEQRFEHFSTNIEQLFFELNELSTVSEEIYLNSGLAEQVASLQGVLFSEQRLIGKWRGSLRLYQEYQSLINKELDTFLKQVPENRDASVANQEGRLTILGWHVTQYQAKTALVMLIVMGLLLTLGLLVSIYAMVVQHKKKLVESVDAVISNRSGDDGFSYGSEDIHQVCSRIAQVAIPKHTEEDYQALKFQLNNQLDVIADMSHATSWVITQGGLASTCKTRVITIAQLKVEAFSSWRQLFSDEQLLVIMKMARNVKEEGVQRKKVTLVSGLQIELTINRNKHQWFGTIAQDMESAELTQEVERLGLECQQTVERAHNSTLHATTKLSKMLVQAMLHSQNLALVSGASVQATYRPLMRMFEWVKQQQIIAQLSLTDQTRNLQDVVLANEIHCATFNMLSEANLQQNHIILECDENLATDAQVDVRIFGRLLVAFCRLTLKDEYKSTLKLVVSAIDQNAGQQLLKFEANVHTAKPLNKLPPHAKLIQEGEAIASLNSVESYFVTLLNLLHGTSIQANLTEKGYSLSFELPITTSIKSQTKPIEFPTSPTNVLVLCSNKILQNVLKKYLDLSSTHVEGLAKVELFSKQYDIQRITRRKLDLVVYVDAPNEKLSGVIEHIEHLPKNRRPKLVVLQDNYHATLSKQGLYSLASPLLSRESILWECERLLRSGDSNNELVSSDIFKASHYLPSQVELLLAVKSPQKHQSLWLVLQWLGFNVKVVCHGKSMQKHWQSGRYLVLFNEFEYSPFIELETGKSIARGVFNFSSDEVMTLDENEAEIGKHWELGVAPEIKRIDALIKLLSPWLKKQPKADSRSPRKNSGAGQTSQNHDVNMTHSKIFDSSLIEQLPPAFDLEEYASNQGSAELAVYMLEDYILSIDEGLSALEKSLTSKSYKDFALNVKQLKLTANILSAKGLLQISQQLNQALQNEAYDNLGRLLEQTKIELSAIKAYAEAI